MTSGDDLQRLWQAQHSAQEPAMQLILEKRTSFQELVRAENKAEYVVALILVPLTTLMAFEVKVPLMAAGFGLLAATLAGLAVATWLVYRRMDEAHDLSVKEHLEALLSSYDRRVRFLRTGTFVVSVLLSTGMVAIFSRFWLFVSLSMIAFCVAQWWSFRRRKAVLLKKRALAEGMLRELGQ